MTKKTKTKKPKILPTKQSALLRLAVQDAKKVEKLKKTHVLDMGVFHEVFEDEVTGKKKCHVCMAGAVMDQTLKTDSMESPDDFNLNTKLYCIDDIRCGYARWWDIGEEYPSEDDARQAKVETKVNAFIQKHFNDDKGRAPWWVYLKAADRLEKLGL